MKRFLCLPLTLTLALTTAACGGTHHLTSQDYLNIKGIGAPELSLFQHCHGYGCRLKSNVALSKKDWQAIRKIFKPAAKTPEKEREKIAKAIGIFETRVGAMTGTDVDIHGTFDQMGDYQQDCVDESINTTIYLTLLEKNGLLKFHTPGAPASRFPLVQGGGWPHQTAVLTETETGAMFVVDSWFYDNGEPPEIHPIADWRYNRINVVPKANRE